MKRLVVGPIMTNCYILDLEDGVIVIDPGGDPEKILSSIGDKKVSAIVATHGHFDHVLAVEELRRVTDAPFYLHHADLEVMKRAMGFYAPGYKAPEPDYDLADGLKGFEVIHTPGHTPGSVCLLRDKVLFSGDTLFREGIGRYDFPESDGEQLARSLQKLMELDDEIEVYPGHGPPTSIGHERRNNPYVLGGL